MSVKKQKLEIVAKLPKSLPLPGSLINKGVKTKLCGLDVTVFTPDFTKRKSDFVPKISIKTTADWEKFFAQESYRNKQPWGSVTGWQSTKGKRGIKTFYVKRVIIITEDSVTPHIAQKMLHALDDWSRLICDWYEVLFQSDHYSKSLEVTQHARDHWGVFINDKGKIGGNLDCKHPINIALSRRDDPKIKPKGWERILNLAATESLPPEAHILLRDARRELISKNYRRSVLDAATAAEISLTKLRDDSLIGIDAKIVKLVQQKYQQISGLVEYLGKIDVVIPPRIQQEIAEPRNLAIHQGLKPDEETAKTCIKKATEIIDLVFPLTV